MLKLNAKQLRQSKESFAKNKQKLVKRHSLILVLDRVYDTFNIGSFFRLADAFAIEKIYLCGQVVTPPNLKIHRASIGTWKWVPWEHSYNTESTIKTLSQDGYQIVVGEHTQKSVSYLNSNLSGKIALILGNETDGVDPKVQSLANQIVHIPMYGVNKSLNVLVAGTILVNHMVQNCYDSR